MRAIHRVSGILTAAFVLATAPAALAADGDSWIVGKSSGEVWLTSTAAQQASLRQEDLVKPGDTIRTGRNGRVLLMRGEETILVSPNSVIGVPAEKKEGLSTTIVQQAGSILLEVEKRNVQHFEVETPYLAAVVKGTQFRVTIDCRQNQRRCEPWPGPGRRFQDRPDRAGDGGPACDRIRERQGRPVAGRHGHVQPDRARQTARAIDDSAGSSARAQASLRTAQTTTDGPSRPIARQASVHPAGHGVTRISSAIGEVRLNVHRVTHGLARDSGAGARQARNAASNKDTVWGSSGPGDEFGPCEQRPG